MLEVSQRGMTPVAIDRLCASGGAAVGGGRTQRPDRRLAALAAPLPAGSLLDAQRGIERTGHHPSRTAQATAAALGWGRRGALAVAAARSDDDPDRGGRRGARGTAAVHGAHVLRVPGADRVWPRTALDLAAGVWPHEQHVWAQFGAAAGRGSEAGPDRQGGRRGGASHLP
ncbi:hypothetical protein L1887_52107 [Cichorium endivia]|nr:hypothetical protein L1887_52107 [Cichorium endivia]